MNPVFKLSGPIAANMSSAPNDVLAAKYFLQGQGFYEIPDWGVTPYPDWGLFDAIKAFQKSKGLAVDGVMKPDGETETAIKAQAQRLQSKGRYGDTILAHITPKEVALLKERGGSGTVNPETGLLEFFEAGKKKGKYIWHTTGDGRVRSSHAKRDGKTFSWDEPPEGGHPGEAPGCRCSAEDVEKNDCTIEWLKQLEISKKLEPLHNRLGDITMEINNLKIQISQNEADIDDLERAATILKYGGLLTRVPHPLAKVAGYASKVTAIMVAAKLLEIRAILQKNIPKLQALEKEQSALKSKISPLTTKKKAADKAYDVCKGK